MLASEAIGPAITFGIWVVIFIVRAARGREVYVAEALAIIGCVVTLQLLLDLHTRHLGDVVIGALHVPYFGAVLVSALRDRRRPDASR